MRIIAGQHGGRLFAAPHGNRTHPMSDKMRGALFNSLNNITGMTILDPFAGSGALSFEAVSRGAVHATAIEQDRSAQRAISENIVALDMALQVKLVKASASAWLRTTTDQFDIVLLDPPYDALQIPLLELLADRVKPDGLIVLSWPGKHEPPVFTGLNLVTMKQYGDSSLYTYRKN